MAKCSIICALMKPSDCSLSLSLSCCYIPCPSLHLIFQFLQFVHNLQNIRNVKARSSKVPNILSMGAICGKTCELYTDILCLVPSCEERNHMGTFCEITLNQVKPSLHKKFNIVLHFTVNIIDPPMPFSTLSQTLMPSPLSYRHSTKKPVTTMLTYPWKCTVLHCNHLGNTWKPLVLMT